MFRGTLTTWKSSMGAKQLHCSPKPRSTPMQSNKPNEAVRDNSRMLGDEQQHWRQRSESAASGDRVHGLQQQAALAEVYRPPSAVPVSASTATTSTTTMSTTRRSATTLTSTSPVLRKQLLGEETLVNHCNTKPRLTVRQEVRGYWSQIPQHYEYY